MARALGVEHRPLSRRWALDVEHGPCFRRWALGVGSVGARALLRSSSSLSLPPFLSFPPSPPLPLPPLLLFCAERNFLEGVGTFLKGVGGSRYFSRRWALGVGAGLLPTQGTCSWPVSHGMLPHPYERGTLGVGRWATPPGSSRLGRGSKQYLMRID